jgi:type III restriction enzyme
MRTWWTSKKCESFSNSHINFTVVDNKWEFLEAKTISNSKFVKSFVKNDHIGFAIMYNHQGVINRYFPDFIIRLNNDNHLILETKGQDTNRDKTKRSFLDEWCKAVNQHGGFGKWEWGVSFNPNDLDEIIQNK